ncbi:MAG: hypothetical protein AAF363_16455 [Bacteroidota bacterium]
MQHLLRRELGDEAFWKGIKSYIKSYFGISIIPKSITQAYNLEVNYLEISETGIPLHMVVSYQTDLD